LFADRLRRRFRQNLKRRRWNANSIRRSNFGRVATFLKLVAEAVAHGNHRLFHIMIEESRCGDGGEKEYEPAQPEGMVM
jgi:hypothetical protein